MVAPRFPRRIVCTLVHISETPAIARLAGFSHPDQRPSRLLPWADPYIAGLVTRLQHEVREEHAANLRLGHGATQPLKQGDAWERRDLLCDLDPPSPVFEEEWEGMGEGWNARCDDLDDQA